VNIKKSIVAHFIEVSTLGFISNVSKFMTAIKIQPLPISVKHKIIKTVLDGLLTVYCNSSSGAISIDENNLTPSGYCTKQLLFYFTSSAT